MRLNINSLLPMDLQGEAAQRMFLRGLPERGEGGGGEEAEVLFTWSWKSGAGELAQGSQPLCLESQPKGLGVRSASGQTVPQGESSQRGF